MSDLNSAETNTSRRPHFDTQAPIIISRDDLRQDPAGRRTLYVLGFSIAGAILTNMAAFMYFTSFYASG
jgi:hypothetical protein